MYVAITIFWINTAIVNVMLRRGHFRTWSNGIMTMYCYGIVQPAINNNAILYWSIDETVQHIGMIATLMEAGAITHARQR